jgi:two-component system OmpR family response regulator
MPLSHLNTFDSSSSRLGAPKSSLAQNLRLLYIEDDPDIRETVKLALEYFSTFRVATTNRQNALALALEQTWDLFLLEVATFEGIDLTIYGQIKEKAQLCDLPIILLTSRIMPDELAHLQQLNIAGIISKPFNPIDLGNQILALL